MSARSRNQLLDIWRDLGADKHLRIHSLRLWSTTHLEKDLDILKPFEKDKILRNDILAERIKRGDISALPQLIKIIRKTNNNYWWQFTRNVNSPELTVFLDEVLSNKYHQASKKWGDSSCGSDWIISELIIRMPSSEAESILLKHWKHLQYNTFFIQAALYVATDKLASLVADVVSNCPDPKSLFEFLDQRYGIKVQGHPGITTIRQLKVLLPYMDYIEEMYLSSFSDLCNERGWYEFRKKHLDPRLIKTGLKYSEYLNTELAIQSLNNLLKENRAWEINLCVENFLKAGASEENVINTVFKWVQSRDKISLDVINLSLEVILQIGNRDHYLKLLSICSEVKDEFLEYFHNAFYLLRKRQLH